jgi:hypothetical protein
MERSEIPHDSRHLWVPSGEPKTMSMPMVRATQTVHLSCMKITLISDWTETRLSLEPHHLGVPSGASKMISESVVRLAQTMHLSSTNTNTVSERKEVRFLITHIT